MFDKLDEECFKGWSREILLKYLGDKLVLVSGIDTNIRFKESEDGFGAVRMREAEGVGAVMAMQSDNEAIIQFLFFFFFLHLSVSLVSSFIKR